MKLGRRPDIEAAVVLIPFLGAMVLSILVGLDFVVLSILCGILVMSLLISSKWKKLTEGQWKSWGPDRGRRVRYVAAYFLLVLYIIGVFAVIPTVTYYRQRARESEAKTNLKSIYAAQKSFHKEFGEYSNDPEKLGYQSEGKLRYRLYIKESDLSPHDREMVPDGQRPFASKERFRAVAVGEESIWVIDQDDNLQRVR